MDDDELEVSDEERFDAAVSDQVASHAGVDDFSAMGKICCRTVDLALVSIVSKQSAG